MYLHVLYMCQDEGERFLFNVVYVFPNFLKLSFSTVCSYVNCTFPRLTIFCCIEFNTIVTVSLCKVAGSGTNLNAISLHCK